MLTITLLGTGGPVPDPHRAGPATLIAGGSEQYLVDDLDYPPPVEVVEVTEGEVYLGGDVRISSAPTDHRPVEPTVAFRFDYGGSSVVAAGDTVPCTGLDRLCDPSCQFGGGFGVRPCPLTWGFVLQAGVPAGIRRGDMLLTA